MPLYDFKCDKCEHTFEHRCTYEDLKCLPPECPKCSSNFTKQVWLTAPGGTRAKDPFDMLHGYRPDSKPIKSFARDKRKGGKDTT